MEQGPGKYRCTLCQQVSYLGSDGIPRGIVSILYLKSGVEVRAPDMIGGVVLLSQEGLAGLGQKTKDFPLGPSRGAIIYPSHADSQTETADRVDVHREQRVMKEAGFHVSPVSRICLRDGYRILKAAHIQLAFGSGGSPEALLFSSDRRHAEEAMSLPPGVSLVSEVHEFSIGLGLYRRAPLFSLAISPNRLRTYLFQNPPRQDEGFRFPVTETPPPPGERNADTWGLRTSMRRRYDQVPYYLTQLQRGEESPAAVVTRCYETEVPSNNYLVIQPYFAQLDAITPPLVFPE